MNNYYSSYQQMYQYITSLNQRITKLEETIVSLQKELKSLKDRPSINVENIEYKFDQLKVETLEGTLNIGLNPNDLGDIEDFAVNTGSMKAPVEIDKETRNGLVQHVENYIDQELMTIIQDNENHLNSSLDPSYYELIKKDITNQIPSRIDFYLQTIPKVENRQDGSSWEENIFEKVKSDIHKAIFTFMSQMPENMKGTNSNEPSSDQP
ncbi:spore germination protein PC [Bacillus pakistanensis]|uniref:Spore germination protein PC n=1 Tax=Rossellomorea pakistanensis TaxID=992288 RepID=A0ABS2NF52_9BACI|nr:spore germination protein GerPC [Bacillus pakistanensis]MBM7586476.1 spore germination protein PC [Bacillus pakistanensis]